jgi:transporter, ni2+-co2+ transporter
LFISQTLACDLCSASTPVAHIKTSLIMDKDEATKVNFDLNFSKNYSDLIIQISDKNMDDNLDQNELIKASEGIKEFFEGKRFVENIIFKENDEKSQLIEPRLKNFILTFKDKQLGANLKFDIGRKEIKENEKIILNINQSKEFFIFAFIPQEPQQLNDKLSFLSTAPLTKQQIATEHNNFIILPNDKIKDFQATLIKVKKPIEEMPKDQNVFSKQTSNYLNQLKTTLKENNTNPSSTSILLVIAFSFLYGFFHAAGPGHAKTLTFSLFAATGESYLKALKFALQVGILHTLGAFILVSLIVLSVGEAITFLGGDVVEIATKVSGGLIVLIALFMLLKMFIKKSKKYSWNPHPDRCDCAACIRLKAPESFSGRKWLVSACASLVPCPGTVLVFLLAFEVGNYSLGLLSGIAMSLGMAVVIFISAIFGSKMNVYGSKLLKNYDYIRFLAIAIMLIVGGSMIVAI